MNPMTLLAEATPIAEAASTLPTWATVLLAIITCVITAVGGMLRKKWKTDGEKTQIDTTKSLMEQKNFIIDQRLIPFAISTIEHWLLTQIPAIVKDAADGNGFQWKAHWSNLLSYTKDEVVQKFAEENIDIIKLFGEKYLDQLLNRLAMKAIAKLPEGVQNFLPRALIDSLTKQAAEFARDKGSELLGVKITK